MIVVLISMVFTPPRRYFVNDVESSHHGDCRVGEVWGFLTDLHTGGDGDVSDPASVGGLAVTPTR